MRLPNLSGLTVRTNAVIDMDTGDMPVKIYVEQYKLAEKKGAAATQEFLGKALGSMLANKVTGLYDQGVEMSQDGKSISFKYATGTKQMRVITMSNEFLYACINYFAKPIQLNYMKELSNAQLVEAWSTEKDKAAQLFYDFSSMRVADAGMRGMCCTDVQYMSPVEGAPPKDYIQEYLCQPWYFRRFMNAVEELKPIWENGDAFNMSFEQLSTLCWKFLGWGNDPHSNRGVDNTYHSFRLTNAYNPDVLDLRAFRDRIKYSEVSMIFVQTAEEYWSVRKQIRATGTLPDSTPFSPPLKGRGAWDIYIKRNAKERTELLEQLNEMWKDYARHQSLTNLVDLIQQFNGNHYFPDGNGRFSMLLIQMHMLATTNRLIYFWNHNPNGPCLSKYVQILNTAPYIPTGYNSQEFDKGRIKQAFHDALETECDAPPPLWLPFHESPLFESSEEETDQSNKRGPVYRTMRQWVPDETPDAKRRRAGTPQATAT
ncbi:MAG: hypothetical protein CMI29_08290 [Opitutae bacterium]|nr:hypothetical protein [Opitutae bacterium]|tara:strand:- start:2852 stop:4306 length:1455 start_codon:yes stop_codon:yes gene_type:complete